jgi:hypothetical protein
MKPFKFKEHNMVWAKDQKEYMSLPAYIDKDSPEGQTIFCWRLSLKERIKLLFTGKLWHRVLTFHNPLQPQYLEVNSPFYNK